MMIEEAFNLYKPWQIAAEFIPFFEYCQHRRFRSILEIGTHKGGLAKFFLEFGYNVVSVDKEKQPEINKLQAAVSQRQYSFVQHDTMTTEFPFQLQGIQFDILFIDGGHTHECSLNDFNKFKHLVKGGGIIAFHDIKNSPLHERQECEVWKTWRALKDDLPERWKEFCTPDEWGGIGVLEV